MFPGTKKDVEKKKKEADKATSHNKVDPPAERPTTSSSSRKPTFDQFGPFNTPARTSLEEPRRPHTSHARHPQSPPEQSPYVNQPLGPLDDMPLRKRFSPPYQGQRSHAGQYPQPHCPPVMFNGRKGLPARPGPQTSAIEPLVDHQHTSFRNGPTPLDNGQMALQRQDGYSNVHSQSHEYADHNGPQEHLYELPDSQSQQANGDGNEPDASQRGSRTEPLYQQEQPYELNGRKGSVPQEHAELAYRGVEPTAPVPSTSEPAMPNFAAIAPGVTENVEREVTLQQVPRAPAYRKPTYGDSASRPAPVRTGLVASPVQQDPSGMTVQSPIADFDFGLPANSSAPALAAQSDPARQPGAGYDDQTARQHRQMPDTVPHGRAKPPQQEFPPRSASRPGVRTQQPTNGYTHPYNQPHPRQPQPHPRQQRPRQPAFKDPSFHPPRRAPRQDYGFDNRGYPQDYTHNGPHRGRSYEETPPQNELNQQPRPLARTHTEPVNQYGNERHQDHYNRGYDQRRQPQMARGYESNQFPNDPSQQRGIPQQYGNREFDQYGNATPPRPRTANSNSARAAVRPYPEQNMPLSPPPNSTFPITDRSHSRPARPGLMTPAPATTPAPAPETMSAPRTSLPRNAQPMQRPPGPPQPASPPQKIPVTIQELNDLRIAFRDNPKDDKLGLKFAKRLVEAATVLANEGGKADAKTAASNRERYINDAHKIVKKLVASGSPDAMFYLADCYGQGALGLEVNPKEAFQLYNSAAKTGHAQSAYRVAVCCELGQDGGGGTRRDHVKAVQFYKRAATLGDGPAMFKMGMIMLKGLLGQQPNRREGVSWLKRAAERADEDNPHALHELAMLHESAQSADVVVRDEQYALQLYTQSANLGYKYSQHRLGSAYEYGTLGVQMDPRQSIAWYSRAAQQGEHQSEFALSGWYLTGSEPLLAQSDTEAYLWARKAAASGLAKAEYAMGYYTEVGIGCQPNLEEAKKWYFRAAGKSNLV